MTKSSSAPKRCEGREIVELQLPEDLLTEAEGLGLDVSVIVEDALRGEIERCNSACTSFDPEKGQ